jgi:hypothetical protein
MIELSNYRRVPPSRRAAAGGSTPGLRAATVIAALGAAALMPLVTQSAMAASPVRQTASPPARAGQAAPWGTVLTATPQGAAAAIQAPALNAPTLGAPALDAPVLHADALHGAALDGLGAKAPRRVPAVQADVWNDLAMCESSGNWHINSGNGFYGGLQFWQPTWERFGGTKYGRRADLATPRHQITIARSVLREQGWTAWPVCSRKLRLGGGTPTGDDTSQPPASQDEGAAQAQPPAQTPDADQAMGDGSGTHTVQPGETLSGIATDAHVKGGWRRLYGLNASVVGDDPDRLPAGTVLTMP